jgi:hypothetical protein
VPVVRSDTLRPHGLLCSTPPRSSIGWLELGRGLVFAFQPPHHPRRRVGATLVIRQFPSVGHGPIGDVEVVVLTLRVLPLELVLPLGLVTAELVAIGGAALVAPAARGAGAGR